MTVKVDFTNINTLSGNTDFNWGKLSFSIPAKNGNGNTCLVDVHIRVPKHLQDLQEIKNYALNEAKNHLKHCAESDHPAP